MNIRNQIARLRFPFSNDVRQISQLMDELSAEAVGGAAAFGEASLLEILNASTSSTPYPYPKQSKGNAMKIGKRSVLKVGVANLHYSEYEHSRIEAHTFSIQRPNGTKGVWQAGGLMKSVRQLQTLALETFKDFGDETVSIRENKGFNSSAIKRLSKEKIADVTDALLPWPKPSPQASLLSLRARVATLWAFSQTKN